LLQKPCQPWLLLILRANHFITIHNQLALQTQCQPNFYGSFKQLILTPYWIDYKPIYRLCFLCQSNVILKRKRTFAIFVVGFDIGIDFILKILIKIELARKSKVISYKNLEMNMWNLSFIPTWKNRIKLYQSTGMSMLETS